jgi:hypothetical protein
LTGSVGTALIVLGATILFTFLVLSGIMILSWVVPKIRTLSGDVQYRLTASLLIIIAVVISFFYLPLKARDSSSDVQLGREVRPPSFGLPFPVLSIRGDPAVIHAEKLGPDSPIRQFARTPLVYLGQSNGTLVLYDPSRKKPVYVSSQVDIMEILPER